ncbi:hypothetical protein BDN72DRAFT_898463 [Pluteus cervinus]|uniref:Uncharacterized protein n=1 Tax=Pluteus cervinus TaxID=181527 RepID=A0ACD3AR57_9AGAR|nr:hypothetical protein BDN72DRAFT_898463 [Pluteus cervinus]
MPREVLRIVVGLFVQKGAGSLQQGGLLSGKDPSEFDTHDPIRLWIVQVGIIIATASLLSLGLRKLRQPKVIAEVLGGILLGPTAFGRIPGFTEHIFPEESRSYLSLVANIGLCLFLFLVGLEIDGSVIKRNARLSATVAFFGMVIPFAFGAALATPLYNTFIKLGAPHGDPELTGPDGHGVQFSHFMLFTGVAYSITAFPVLCRILTELKLLDTTVGIVVLSAGVANDVVGWVLLALCVALVNANSAYMALWILLACVGWTTFMLFPVRMALRWLARRTGSIESGPTVFFMTVTILVVFGSAFFTDIIGVHAIFGAFIAGLIVPRQGNLTIALTEKLEDMVSIIFLPLYFTLSGLSTDLGLLNDGITWAYTIGIIFLAFTGKFGGCTIAARYFAHFNLREASAIGSLMSCKGLVELIVLNVGLSAGILSRRVFSMFVLEALLLTFLTTPLVTALYPPHIRVRVAPNGANFTSLPGDQHHPQRRIEKGRRGDASASTTTGEVFGIGRIRKRVGLILDKLDHLPAVMAVTQLIIPPSSPDHSYDNEWKKRRSVTLVDAFQGTPGGNHEGAASRHSIFISALRLIELTDRHSAIMKSSLSTSLLQSDPLLAIFRTFVALIGLQQGTTPGRSGDIDEVESPAVEGTGGQAQRPFDNHIASTVVNPGIEIVPQGDMAWTVREWADREDVDIVIVPWTVQGFNQGGTSMMGSRLGAESTGPNSPRMGELLLAPTPPTDAHGVPSTPKSTHITLVNPFEGLFGRESGASGSGSGTNGTVNRGRRGNAPFYSGFVRGVFSHGKKKDVGLYVDMNCFQGGFLDFGLGTGLGPGDEVDGELLGIPSRQHLYLPFFGGPDDRLALEMVVQLCLREGVEATVVRFVKTEAGGSTVGSGMGVDDVQRPSPAAIRGQGNELLTVEDSNGLTVASGHSIIPDTVYGDLNTETRLLSDTADNLVWAQCINAQGGAKLDGDVSGQVGDALRRIRFREVNASGPLRVALQEAKALMDGEEDVPSSSERPRIRKGLQRRVVVITGRSRRLAVEDHGKELRGIVEEYTSSGGQFGTLSAGIGGTVSHGGGSGSGAVTGLAGDVRKTVGDVATAFIVSGVGAGVLVLQASEERRN